MAELRTYVFIDSLQPQFASFLATVARGYLPVAGQAALFVEISPGIAINQVTDVALKSTRVRPGMQIVERLYGMLEIHSDSQADVRQAGAAILKDLDLTEDQRIKPKVYSSQVIRNVDDHQTMLINRMRHGNLITRGQSLYIMEVAPAAYAALMEDLMGMVVGKYDGSLKAEHGTGRNMAPYVELEWGPEGMALMRRIKALLDPDGLLNPGVIINDDPNAHLTHLKPMPASDAIVDPCIECGFCEAVCPSRTLSLSPRQRIVLYRELARRNRADEPSNQLARLFDYQGIDTCAATGLCADRCPVGINTGALIKKLRTDKYQRFVPIARWSADHFAGVTRAARGSLGLKAIAGKLLGDKALAGLVGGVRKLSGQRSCET